MEEEVSDHLQDALFNILSLVSMRDTGKMSDDDDYDTLVGKAKEKLADVQANCGFLPLEGQCDFVLREIYEFIEGLI